MLKTNKTVPTYLLIGDAARSIGVSTTFVGQFALDGRLAIAARTIGGVLLFEDTEVAKFADARAHRANGKA